ncbi:MAG TPA: FAD-binding oxidoreductase [Thiolinea sp.]|nr:FAD-binding oxidoreductase [Thiolinea sp.]
MPVSAPSVIEALQAIVGSRQVLLEDADRAKYETDAMNLYCGRALAVVRPASTAEVSAIMKLAHQTRTPVVPIGGNTGLNGGAWPGGDGSQILLSLERLNRIRAIKPAAQVMIAEAGCILDHLHQAAREHGMTFPLTFGARGSCMLGGNLSTNAGGSNVVRYGNTRELCLGLEVVLPDGRILDLLSELRKDNTGYDLKDLYIGAEGTLGVITAAVMKLALRPKAYATAMVALPDVASALILLNRLQSATSQSVEAFEYMPRNYLRRLLERFPTLRNPFDELPEVGLLLEIGATAPRDAEPEADGSLPVVNYLEQTLAEYHEADMVLDAVVAQNENQRREMWAMREAAYEVMIMKQPLIMTDVSVPLDSVQPFLERMGKRLHQLAPEAEEVIVAHLGDGNVHYSLWPDPEQQLDSTRLAARKTAIVEAVEDTVLELGGSFSAEHGIGVYKKDSMARRKNPLALQLMHQIKQALDPLNIMNPGKVLPE